MSFFEWLGLVAVVGASAALPWMLGWPVLVVGLAPIVVGAFYLSWIIRRHEAGR
ncbi:hypothetical protein PUW79_07955 [Microbacterium sp. NE2HP2]|uniref:hypothetical protein n=1 Tax=Microbacterium plantarum TaxID=1816425 RepID=UPI002365A734|nr:hypothetical protein [Microbacterium plantarum]MDD7944561.1 hypothetical protein [Microbacterium plantarum]